MKKFWLRILIISILTLTFGSLSAKSVVEIYMEGGAFMHIITALFVIMIIFAIIKYYQLAIREKLDAKSFYLKLKGYIRNKQYDESAKISAQFKTTTLGFIFWSGFLAFIDAKKSGRTGTDLENALKNAFDEAGLQTIPKVEAGLFWLDVIAQVATFLGLLGTIFGLILAFDALAKAPEALKQIKLTEGISQAMGTTAYGLIVAIITMFIKGGLQARADRIINDIDEYSVKLINQITYSLKD
ncbi:MAG TPA: MotA/TolQ/ExbB proton channel family protein [Candidatus Cloacimonetes bacterium]|nr:MotA/TolQ/ExbB proton channel family protein [Candidatus Cloacimonadota bacterium]